MVGAMLVLDVFSMVGASLPMIGILFGIGSALTYAFYNVYADLKMVQINHFTVLFYTMTFSLGASFITLMGVEGAIPAISFAAVIKLLIIGIVSGILPVIFFYRSVALIGSERTSIVATLEIPITLLVAFVVIGERMGLIQLVGVLLVIGASMLLHYGDDALKG